MEFSYTGIKGLYTVHLKEIKDERGLFARTFCKAEFKRIGFDKEFVQFNHSFNKHKGIIRGMHFQNPPYGEAKLIRCVQGAVFDVAVDLRFESATFLQHFGTVLSAENMVSILIPEGFAHGFQALEDNTSLIYHHTAFYNPDADNGVRYDDPELNIAWKLTPRSVSDKDKNYKRLDKNFKGIIK